MLNYSGLVHGTTSVHANDGRDVDGRLPVGVGRSPRREHPLRRFQRRHRSRRSQLSLQQGKRAQDSGGKIKSNFDFFNTVDWKLLNGITLGQTITDPINQIILKKQVCFNLH